jgi:hypothetical protein
MPAKRADYALTIAISCPREVNIQGEISPQRACLVQSSEVPFRGRGPGRSPEGVPEPVPLRVGGLAPRASRTCPSWRGTKTPGRIGLLASRYLRDSALSDLRKMLWTECGPK